MKYQYLLLGVLYGLLLSSCSLSAEEGDKEMDRYIANLMGKMTLHEKLGQLNLPSGGDLVTGNVNSAELTKMVRNQEIGGFFNVKGIRKIVDLQRIAIDSTRLGIPLLVGADVIHGYETIFPIPLALSCSWDTLAVERMARISAVEASADGICWTFSPLYIGKIRSNLNMFAHISRYDIQAGLYHTVVRGSLYLYNKNTKLRWKIRLPCLSRPRHTSVRGRGGIR